MRLLQNYRLWRLVLVSIILSLSPIAFWPSPVDEQIQGLLASALQFLHSKGIPGWFSYALVEVSANVALFIPMGVVSSLAFPQHSRWRIGALGLLVSGCIELGQLLFLDERIASPSDLVTNASGAIIGAFATSAAIKKLQARPSSAAGLRFPDNLGSRRTGPVSVTVGTVSHCDG